METGYFFIIIISRAFRKYKAKRNAGRTCTVSACPGSGWINVQDSDGRDSKANACILVRYPHGGGTASISAGPSP